MVPLALKYSLPVTLTSNAQTAWPHIHSASWKIHTYHSGDCEVTGMHLLRQPVNFPASVAEDDSLSDCERLIKITQGVQLPVLPTHQSPTSSKMSPWKLWKINSTSMMFVLYEVILRQQAQKPTASPKQPHDFCSSTWRPRKTQQLVFWVLLGRYCTYWFMYDFGRFPFLTLNTSQPFWQLECNKS